jgi:hypothetical protein
VRGSARKHSNINTEFLLLLLILLLRARLH